jgi:hypothetical protein
MAETVDHANWETLGQLAEALPDGAMRETLRAAVREVEEDEDVHLSWARDTRARLTMIQVSSSVLTEKAAATRKKAASKKSSASKKRASKKSTGR